MAQAVNVNFRMDADLKKSMEQACSELGMSMTTAFTIFAKKVSRERRIPFEVSVDPFFLRPIRAIWRGLLKMLLKARRILLSMNWWRKKSNAAALGRPSLG